MGDGLQAYRDAAATAGGRAGPTFARRVFLVAGIYGIVALAPQVLRGVGSAHTD